MMPEEPVISDEVAEKYLRFYNTPFGKRILEKEVRFVESKVQGCRAILSIGCGPGFLEKSLCQRHPEKTIVCLEKSLEMIQYAPDQLYRVCGDAQYLSFFDGVFDAVFYVTSLEFICDYTKALAESHRVLKPLGVLLILMLNPKSLYFKEEFSDSTSYINKHIKHVDTEKIKEYVSQYFSVETEEYFLGIRQGNIYDSDHPKYASLYVVRGIRYGT